MFGDNFFIVNSTFMPAGKLQRHSCILNYHCTREYQAKLIIKSVRINGNDNPADIVTKSRSSNTWFPLMKPLLFWRDIDFLKKRVVAEGSENRSSIPPLYQSKVTPQQSFNIDIKHILGD